MKSVLISSVVAAAITFSVGAKADPTKEELKTQAAHAYAMRDFNQAGINNALDAAKIYADLAKDESDSNAKASLLIKQSEALYFAGYASTNKDRKLERHLLGSEIADKGLVILGLKDPANIDAAAVEKLKKLPQDQLAIVAEGLYFRGINLGQWGNARGVVDSLGRWPELRTTMETIVKIGFKQIHEFGAYRVLGRAYFKIPGLLGGSNEKAEKYLSAAVAGSLANPQDPSSPSTNGLNNTYFAELLIDLNRITAAKKLLNAFIAADPETLNLELIPETKHVQGEAKDLLKTL